MPHKQLLFHAAAREKVLRGATALADAVRVTLGPKSKSVLIGRAWGRPTVCNDGVSIAKELSLKDPEEDVGVQIIREAAERTGDAVGDGTTTSTLLAHAIFAEGLRNIAAGASAIDLKRGIERGLHAAVDAVRSLSRPVQSRQEKIQVATVAAHNDAAIGELVGDAVEKVGGEGVISVEEAKGTETAVEVVQGMQFDRGYLSPYFVTDPERMECVLEEPLILIHEKRIGVMKDLLPLLEQVAKEGQSFLLIAEEVEGDALATLVVNKLRGTLACVAVKRRAHQPSGDLVHPSSREEDRQSTKTAEHDALASPHRRALFVELQACHAANQADEPYLDLPARQAGTQTPVRTKTERDVLARRARDVETIGLVEDLWIPVRRCYAEEDRLVSLDALVADLQIFCRDPANERHRSVVAQALLYSGPDERRVLTQLIQLVWVHEERMDRVAKLVDGRDVSGREDQYALSRDLLRRQLSFLLPGHEEAHQVVARAHAPPVDDGEKIALQIAYRFVG
ncbi:chaperonin GroEL [Sorangium sp. So ce302]